jgi:hypothetical protein
MDGSLLRVVPEGRLQDQEAEQAVADNKAAMPYSDMNQLAAHIRTRWDIFRRYRTEVLTTATSGTTFNTDENANTLNNRLLKALRAYQGEYSPQKIAEIAKFGGSRVYAKITTVKCRGATAMLRDIFINGVRTWDVEATPEPVVPDEIQGNIDELVMMEAQHMQSAGQPVDDIALSERKQQLEEAAKQAALKQADKEAKEATELLDDYLVEGGFYEALGEFLIDLPIFYIACMKGPVVKMSKELKWVGSEMTSTMVPKMFWQRVSPFDIYWTPGACRVEDAEMIEKVRFTRADLNALIGIPGYDETAIRAVLEKYKDGYKEYPDEFESERADLESREDFHTNQSGLIEGLEYHGSVQGQSLIDAGFPSDNIVDPTLDYTVVVWQIAEYVIKAQLNPNPRERHGYYISSFEKVPGSIPGNGVPDIIDDAQSVANASLRSLVNNMSIASGPQVAVNEDRLGPNTDPDSLYPWKRWRFEDDPSGSQTPPISFFQPQSNATELMAVFNQMTTLADETSAIPRYLTGGSNVGGAAKTASGLSMLMNNASKVLQNIAAQIDTDVFAPILQDLYDFIMLTDDTGMLTGDENIRVRGVTVAIQKEQDRMRKLEFLQMTGNPIDSQIVGVKGRAAILRDVANDLGMPGEKIIPSETELDAREKAVAMANQGSANTPAPSENPNPGEETDNNFRTNA